LSGTRAGSVAVAVSGPVDVAPLVSAAAAFAAVELAPGGLPPALSLDLSPPQPASASRAAEQTIDRDQKSHVRTPGRRVPALRSGTPTD
jgi:hypothetical protein